jgi:hypothetical protein
MSNLIKCAGIFTNDFYSKKLYEFSKRIQDCSVINVGIGVIEDGVS